MSQDQFNKVGRIIDSRFRLKSLIGSGGMASVYEAEQFMLNRTVALKLMHVDLQADPQFRKRFLRECQLLSAISHPYIVNFLHYGIDNGDPYLVMEYCTGKTLRAFLDEKQSCEPPVGDAAARLPHVLPTAVCVGLVKSIAQALSAMHEQKIVHRDLTPQNILVIDAATNSIKIIDFGLAFLNESSGQKLTSTGALVGSIQYMSPEQCIGTRATTASDVYALGCILFEMLEGAPLVQSDSPVVIIKKHKNEEPPPFRSSAATSNLESICRLCLNKEPRHRPAAADVAMMLQLFEEKRNEELVQMLAGYSSIRKTKHGAQSRLITAVVALMVVVLVSFLLARGMRSGDSAATVSLERKSDLTGVFSGLESQSQLTAGLSSRIRGQYSSGRGGAHAFSLEDAANLARKYEKTRSDLCLLASEIGLDAFRPLDANEDVFSTLLHFKLLSLWKLKIPRETVRRELESEHLRRVSQLGTARGIKSTEIELLFLEGQDPGPLSLEYFRAFRYKGCVSDCSVVNIVRSTLAQHCNSGAEFDALALPIVAWISSGKKFVTAELLDLCSLVVQCTCEQRPKVALAFWSLLPPGTRAKLCTQAPYDIGLVKVFSSLGPATELNHQLMELARSDELEGRPNLALEHYRMLIHEANVQRKSGGMTNVPPSVLKSVDALFEQLIDRQLEFWIVRVLATVQEEEDLGFRSEAARLLRLCTRSRIQRLSATRQREVEQLLDVHQKSLNVR